MLIKIVQIIPEFQWVKIIVLGVYAFDASF